jgi:hypothetical protein
VKKCDCRNVPERRTQGPRREVVAGHHGGHHEAHFVLCVRAAWGDGADWGSWVGLG